MHYLVQSVQLPEIEKMIQFLQNKPTFELLPELIDPMASEYEGIEDAEQDEEEIILKKVEPEAD